MFVLEFVCNSVIARGFASVLAFKCKIFGNASFIESMVFVYLLVTYPIVS